MLTKIGIFLYTFAFSVVVFGQTFEGKVVDNKTKEPIPFARVTIASLHLNATTDSIGVFRFEQLPKSYVEFKITAFDYGAALIKINVATTTVFQFELTPQHILLDEVIISASDGKLRNENITSIEYRSKKSLFESGATTMGEALNLMAGVQQVTIGVGIAKPVIRGLGGMRVVSYWSGLRIENQQWGDDHGMGASEVGLQGIEIIKGPASILYGADALGGVIHYIDEDYASTNTSEGYASTRFESNSMGTTTEVGYRINKGKLKFNLFANYINHADFQLASGRFIQNSRFWGTNVKMSLGYRKGNYVFNLRYHTAYNRLGIPGHTHNDNATTEDFLRDARSRRATLPAQLIFNNFLLAENKWFLKRAELLFQLGNTNNFLREFDEKVTVPRTRLGLNNSTYNLRYTFHLLENMDLKFGAQGMFQTNRNTGTSMAYLIPDGNSIDNGAYVLLSATHKKWRFQAGLRHDIRLITSFRPEVDSSLTTNLDVNPIDRRYSSWNTSVGAVHNTKRTTTRFNVSSGFRAPHLAELLTDGLHHGSSRYERGDRNLVSEQAIQLDVALELHFEHLEIIINPYFNRIQNFIYLQNTDSLIGSYKVFEFQQLDLAYLYGGEVGVHYHPHRMHRLHLESNFSITIGQDSEGNALNLMPQPNTNNRIRFDIANKQKLQVKSVLLEHQYFLPQNRVGMNELPSGEYHLVHLAFDMAIRDNDHFSFKAGVRNLTNSSYIAHLSPFRNLGIPQPGINFFFSVKYNFSKQYKNK